MKRTKAEQRTKWWMLKRECCVAFRETLRQDLGGQEVLPNDWTATANMIRVTDKKVLGVSSGWKADKETWWCSKEVQECVHRKSLTKKKRDIEKTEQSGTGTSSTR